MQKIKIPTLFQAILLTMIALLLKSCASIVAPTGGPKDEKGPKLLLSVPKQNSLNYVGKRIELVFDEDITLNNLTTELLISPNVKNKFKHSLIKNKLKIEFENAFPDSTTISMNFRSAIKDQHEGNPFEDFTLAFSTGDKLDTAKVRGSVSYLENGKTADGVLVSLFAPSDTLNYKTSPPIYSTKTKKDGSFELTNIKKGNYRLASFSDANNNLKYDNKAEQLFFPLDTLFVKEDTVTSNALVLSSYDDEKPKIIYNNKGDNAALVDLNEGIDSLFLKQLNINESLQFYYDNKTNRISIPNVKNEKDSLQITIFARDSTGNVLFDTIFIKFGEKIITEKADTLKKGKKILNKLSITPASGNQIISNTKIELKSETALSILPQTKILFIVDSTKKLEKPIILEPLTKKSFTFDLSDISFSKKLTIFIPSDKISDLENKKIDPDTIVFTKKADSQIGSIKGTIKDTLTSAYIVQLFTTTGQFIAQVNNKNPFQFKNLNPGNYKLRIIEDKNNNGRWDQGNIKKNLKPENIIQGKEEIVLKAGWDLEDVTF